MKDKQITKAKAADILNGVIAKDYKSRNDFARKNQMSSGDVGKMANGDMDLTPKTCRIIGIEFKDTTHRDYFVALGED